MEIPSLKSFKEVLGFNGGIQAGKQPYLVDLVEEAVEVEIINPTVDAYFKTMSEDAIIGRFNGLWPSSSALYQWVFENWTKTMKNISSVYMRAPGSG
ncbi:hypothetical protein KI387_034661, partial [Taxus chinensis]